MRTKDPRGKSLIVRKNVRIGHRQASVGLEEQFWIALKEIAGAQGSSMAQVIGKVDSARQVRRQRNLSSAGRLFILDHYYNRREQALAAKGKRS